MTLQNLEVPNPNMAVSLTQFVPPPRFGEKRFKDYKPQHASQVTACETTRAFVSKAQAPQAEAFRWPWQKAAAPRGEGLYLDGGFGVGKTHLLASAYNAYSSDKKAYLSFQDLVYTIGALGKDKAREALSGYGLFCIDEFELDDPGNTLIVKSFLSHAFEQGAYVITTSNTPPEAQGQGRFNAEDFKREIQSIAERFETLHIEGKDYRHRERLSSLYSDTQLETLLGSEPGKDKLLLTWAELLELLNKYHPIRYSDVLKGIGTLYLKGVSTLPEQNNALRFVHFIDKLYDLKVGLRASGTVDLENIFHSSYRRGAFAKKHYRCLSRLSELLEENVAELAA